MNSVPKMEQEYQEIRVQAGQCLTVWAGSIQVEIRVSSGGKALVFCNETVHPFSEWDGLVQSKRVK